MATPWILAQGPIMNITPAMLFVAALNQTPLLELESAWWDCDVLYQQDQLINQEYVKCVKINEEFRTHFSNDDVFFEYWQSSKQEQWSKRGYTPAFEDDAI